MRRGDFEDAFHEKKGGPWERFARQGNLVALVTGKFEPYCTEEAKRPGTHCDQLVGGWFGFMHRLQIRKEVRERAAWWGGVRLV